MSAKRVAKSTPIRTALTAAAIIGAGVITGTLLALSPIFDEASGVSVPQVHTYSPLLSSGSLIAPRPSSDLPRREPQPHIMHGVRPFNPAHQNLYANL